MAVFESKEALLASLKEIVGENTDDSVISFLEDVSDTYDSLTVPQEDETDWKAKYEENDAAWKKKYTDRFFSKPEDPTPPVVSEPRMDDDSVTFEDLFIEKEG